MPARMIDRHGMSVEVTPSGYLVRDRYGNTITGGLGHRVDRPRDPAALADLGVDLASLVAR